MAKDTMQIEWIKDGEDVLALIIPEDYQPEKTEFLTPGDYKQQLGFIVYKGGESIIPHIHKPIKRTISGTPETLTVRTGKMEVSIFNKKRELVTKRILNKGDTIVLVEGGHGFRMVEDTVLMEVKQGPYVGMDDKELFH